MAYPAKYPPAVNPDNWNAVVDALGGAGGGGNQLGVSYIIFTDGTNYYARNGSTGVIDWSSTNASYVVNSAIASGSVWIQFAKGIFTFTAPIDVVLSNTRLSGINPQATTLKLADGVTCNLIQHTNGGYIYFTVIEHMCLTGNKDNGAVGYGINLGAGTMDTTLSDLFVSSFKSGGVKVSNAWNLDMNEVIVEYCEGWGIDVGTGYDAKVHSCKVFNNTKALTLAASNSELWSNYIAANQEEGVRILQPASDVKIFGNNFIGEGYTHAGLYDQLTISGATTGTDRIQVFGNSFDGAFDGTIYSYRQIVIDVNCRNTQIYGNTFVNQTNAVLFSSGIETKIYNNYGFCTENLVSGTNSTATTFALTTGLAGNVTFASYMFDATTQAIADFKVVSGVQTSPTVWTVTVSGTDLPAEMTCTADLRYVP